jgi:hypothetical protein
MSVARCQAEVGWLAYYQIEPFGTEMDDLRAGVVAAAIYNVNRDVKKRADPFVPADVIPWMGGLSKNAEPEPILLDDVVAQSNLMRAALFGQASHG